jgi:hypothetical protein
MPPPVRFHVLDRKRLELMRMRLNDMPALRIWRQKKRFDSEKKNAKRRMVLGKYGTVNPWNGGEVVHANPADDGRLHTLGKKRNILYVTLAVSLLSAICFIVVVSQNNFAGYKCRSFEGMPLFAGKSNA